jgi:hypothetical protein
MQLRQTKPDPRVRVRVHGRQERPLPIDYDDHGIAALCIGDPSIGDASHARRQWPFPIKLRYAL